MTETTLKRPLITRTGLIVGALALTLPFIADRVIVSAMSEAKTAGIGVVIGMAAYTAAPFLLLDSAMRPRRRVRLALWAGLALTAIIWLGFARSGFKFQAFAGGNLGLRDICAEIAERRKDDLLTAADAPQISQCDAYGAAGNAHVGFYMLTMIWPAIVPVLMGVGAKFGEKDHAA